ncbi:hypothetical protein LTR99_011074 [Exophiala xenobiotica]|uniref:Uncharacterized protein n=1 Tax=Vermiconidia calcicola TaxID=1690605 RepID=A0AAV9PST7_9PEZI|nr:hypothetical protein LTR99_011074 [Exophiala xenobiotica]KAK5401649.1 hypothetical protein LTR06_011013 [Exophiala xenobiotica]KAK5425467.1 hypothetical protein LTR34_011075 [Exophiala xenobiotica]KAK5527596.1 hypothetical protein LTR25_011045 [Vermiconidia calcicola]KAK5529042.1 hypothetical protein LTR23_010842 [Chaetothyriales sp. CCFEE 6169]
MQPTPQSQDDISPPLLLPSSYHERFVCQLRSDSLTGIGIRPISNSKRPTECTVDWPGPGQEDQELSDSDVSSFKAHSIFSDLSSNVDESFIGTAASEDEISTAIGRIAFHVNIEIQVFERDIRIPSREVPSSDEHSWPSPTMFQRAAEELINASHTLIRVFIEDHRTLDLNAAVGDIIQVPSITSLNDGSWEILVRKVYLPTLQRKLHKIHIRFTLDSEYHPLKPLHQDVEYWGLENARKLYALWFMGRAIKIIQKSWTIAQMYYGHLLKLYNGKIRTLLSGMGTIGESFPKFHGVTRGLPSGNA